MKKIKVYLQYPWKFPDSSYYKNILDFPPKDISYINYKESGKKMDVIGSGKKFESMRVLKNRIRKILRFLHLPNLTITPGNNYDLVHCAHCLSLNRKPWVVDTEVYDRLASAGGNVADKGVGKWIIKNRLESKYCKKIIAWSEDCKKTFERAFPNNHKILNKITILPFAIPKITFRKISHNKLRILFVARWFDAKGGRQTLEVFDRLSKQYKNVEFIFICPIPVSFKKKYSSNKQIKILDLMPQQKLFEEIYPLSDIFFYPGFGDSYGFAVPEALAYGLPVITTNTFAKSELVSDGKTGFLIDLPKDWQGYEDMNELFIQSLVEKTSLLIKNKSLRKKMSREAIKEARDKFSIEKRNEKLRKIYEESSKN
jgi:glycosyltransferase involved in cell wall biosynthesis